MSKMHLQTYFAKRIKREKYKFCVFSYKPVLSLFFLSLFVLVVHAFFHHLPLVSFVQPPSFSLQPDVWVLRFSSESDKRKKHHSKWWYLAIPEKNIHTARHDWSSETLFLFPNYTKMNFKGFAIWCKFYSIIIWMYSDSLLAKKS